MPGKHLMNVIVAILLQMGRLRGGELKWVTGGHFLVQWQSQIPVMCLSFILHLWWNLASCKFRPLFPTHAKLYLLEPQPSKFPVVLTRDISGFIFCCCVGMNCSLSLYVPHYEGRRAENAFVYSYEMSHLGKITVIPVFIPFPQTRINPVLFRKPDSAQAFPFCHSVPESLLW